jgi:hypothetical protein
MSFLFSKGILYNTICLHKSAISVTLAPVDGVLVGSHPLVARALKGIRNKRPPKRKIPPFWEKQKVLDMFRHWKRPISLAQTIKKGAFLIMILSAKRPSEVAHLLSDPDHLQFGDHVLRIIPSKDFLSKTDRHNHSCPQYFVRSCPEDQSICPTQTVKLIQEAKLEFGFSIRGCFSATSPPTNLWTLLLSLESSRYV